MARDDWGAFDDHDDDDPEPDPEADPSCIQCGGQGGWCRDFTPDGQCIWVDCDCLEWPNG